MDCAKTTRDGDASLFPRDNKAWGCMAISKLTKTRRGRDLDLKKKLGLGCKDPQEQTSGALLKLRFELSLRADSSSIMLALKKNR